MMAAPPDLPHLTRPNMMMPPTSYLLEIVVLTPGGSTTCFNAIDQFSSPNPLISTITKSVTVPCSSPPSTSKSNLVIYRTHTVTVSDCYSTITLTQPTNTQSGLSNTTLVSPKTATSSSPSLTSVPLPLTTSTSRPLLTSILSLSDPNPNPTLPTTMSSHLTSQPFPNVAPTTVTITETITQRIVSLQNVKLVRKYPDE